MKRNLITILAVVVFALPAFSQKKDKKVKETTPQKEEIQLKNKLDTVSYILGSDIGKNIKASGIEVNVDIFSKGMAHGMAGIDSLFTKEQVEKIMMDFQQEMMAKQQSQDAGNADENKAKGAAFLEQNKTKAGVKTTASGLQYEVVTEGTGAAPAATDEVTVYYSGKLLDGSVFDATQPGSPISFGLNGVIPGWTEGLQLMKEGGKNIFYIPSNLAYGDRSVGPIPAGSTLIFEVELVSIKKP
jgi:FKBP-type peptidyl-prolyl cis-trans isomerase